MMDRITFYTFFKRLWHRYPFASALGLAALWHLFPLLFLERTPPALLPSPAKGIALSLPSFEWNQKGNDGKEPSFLQHAPPSPSLPSLFPLSQSLLSDRSGKEASNRREELVKQQLTLSPYESSKLSLLQHDASLMVRPLRGNSSHYLSQLKLNDEIQQLLKELNKDYYIVCEVTCLNRHGCLTWQILEGELPSPAWQGAIEDLFQSIAFSSPTSFVSLDRIELALFLSKARPAL